jgi:hypothetical protein
MASKIVNLALVRQGQLRGEDFKEAIANATLDEDEVPGPYFDTPLDEFMAKHAIKCAAWLVRKMKKHIHEAGGFLVHMPYFLRKPKWFILAIECLQSRSVSWEVKSGIVGNGRKKRRQYVVKWKRRMAARATH